MGHTVRLIAIKDLPPGGRKAYQGDVITVKAGYARNYLLPQKYAVYATPQNFEKYNVVDPDSEEAKLAAKKEIAEDDKLLQEADLLKKYLKDKVLKIWRNVDPNSTEGLLFPGVVTAGNLCQKLSKQLRIDLETEKETIHIYHDNQEAGDAGGLHKSTDTNAVQHQQQRIAIQPIDFAELDDSKIQAMADNFVPSPSDFSSIKINRLGEYLAVIGLAGGYKVPLRFVVIQR